jgi:hypothetical protein
MGQEATSGHKRVAGGKFAFGQRIFQWDRKQHLGMGECQLRDGLGQTRHMHLVVLAYTAGYPLGDAPIGS